nr:MAG TPA: hypothetical protein [Caudoviricetes sp.]
MQELFLIIVMIFSIGNIQIKIGKFEIKVIGIISKAFDLL